jgi:hypothetical protein
MEALNVAFTKEWAARAIGVTKPFVNREPPLFMQNKLQFDASRARQRLQKMPVRAFTKRSGSLR